MTGTAAPAHTAPDERLLSTRVRVTLPTVSDDLQAMLASVRDRLGPLDLQLEHDPGGVDVLVFTDDSEDLWTIVLRVMNAVVASGYDPIQIVVGQDTALRRW